MGEPVEFRADGTIALSEPVAACVLRRPTIGDMRKVHEHASAADEAASQPESSFESLYGEEGPYVLWWRDVIRMLADSESLPPDGWPSYMASPPFVRRVLRHWREVPLALGGGGEE